MWVLGLAWIIGCGWPQPDGVQRVEAHRAAAGYWPANSALAVTESIRADFDAIEVDLVLTADGVPILNHDPGIDRELCTTNLYSPVRQDRLISALTAAELREGYLCGGLPDPAHPNAELFAAPLMTFDEMLVALERASTDVLVHLDVKVEEPLTASATESAQAILSRWVKADLPNPWLISANTPETLLAFRAVGAELGVDVFTQLIVPFHPTGGSETATALGFVVPELMGTQDMVSLAQDAQADSIAIHHELVSRHSVRVAKAEGFEVLLWTLNKRADVLEYLAWDIDGIITDYPWDAP